MKNVITKMFSCIMVVAILVSMCAPVVSANEYEISPLCTLGPRNECN